MRRPMLVLVALALAVGLAGQATPARGAEVAVNVAIIVGPVGAELTPVYIDIAEAAAAAAEAHGATVRRAYSPDATADNVLAAVDGANIVVYLGHGVGTPNPYSDHPNPATTNGWGLNGPGRRGDHADSWQDGSLAYYGEAWIAAHAHPAPGWVMIYSNACYAAGASEQWIGPATEAEAATRVTAYSHVPLAELGASAYFAVDFFKGAAHIIERILATPDATYGQIFAGEATFTPDALTMLADTKGGASQVWLHRSAYFDGRLDYWYAFAGDPSATPSATMLAGVAIGAAPGSGQVSGAINGRASSYAGTPGWEGRPTVALPIAEGIAPSATEPPTVLVCADRCAELPVVDSCPCYAGTPDARVANLSLSAWELISDKPLEEGLIAVSVILDGSTETPPAPMADSSPEAGPATHRIPLADAPY